MPPATARPRRARPASLALTVLSGLVPVLLLTGCGSGGSSDAASSTSSSAKSSSSAAAPKSTSLDGVHVDTAAAAGTAPKVTVDSPLSVGTTQTKVLTEGGGAAVKTGDLVSVQFVGVNGATGTQFGVSDWSKAPTSFVLGDSVIKGFTTALEGVKQGSLVETAVAPADGYGPQGGLSAAKIGKDDTLVYVIRVDAVGAARAQGTPVTPTDPNLPKVTLDAATGAPTITTDPEVAAPTSLVVQPLIKGAGEVVKANQSITVQYTGIIYGTGTVFDTSWKTGGAPLNSVIGAGQLIPGWDTGIVGQTVGSQVLLVVPPAEGYGAQGQESAGISGTDTLVFVVDILAAS